MHDIPKLMETFETKTGRNTKNQWAQHFHVQHEDMENLREIQQFPKITRVVDGKLG